MTITSDITLARAVQAMQRRLDPFGNARQEAIEQARREAYLNSPEGDAERLRGNEARLRRGKP
jgi:hypothetical protein